MSASDVEELESGLYLVATPLGNLGDLSERARDVMSRAFYLAGENSQVGRKWLEILGKDAPEDWRRPHLLSYRESSREKDGTRILEFLRQGRSVALISDAGTPAISDPGWHLVQQVRAEGLPVWSIPGPCAAAAALAASGFPARRFRFEGFLPQKGRLRREALERLTHCSEPVVLYESPHRFLSTLEELAEAMPERDLFVSREMTKRFEEGWRGALDTAPGVWSEKMVKGEFTLVLGPKDEHPDDEPESLPKASLDFMLGLGLPTKTGAKILHHFYPHLSKKELYKSLTADSPSR